MLGSQYKSLSSLGDFRSGYSARKKLDTKPEFATHWLLPARAITNFRHGEIDWSKLQPIFFEGNDSRYTLKDGDVLISIRGNAFAAWVKQVPEKVIALSNWVIFSPSPEIDGEFFVWWFNLPSTQRQLEKVSQGSASAFISFKDLKGLKVPVPTLVTQKRIGRLQALRKRERELVQRLEVHRDRLTDALSLKLLEI